MNLNLEKFSSGPIGGKISFPAISYSAYLGLEDILPGQASATPIQLARGLFFYAQISAQKIGSDFDIQLVERQLPTGEIIWEAIVTVLCWQ